jgi:hypothetical protein
VGRVRTRNDSDQSEKRDDNFGAEHGWVVFRFLVTNERQGFRVSSCDFL